MFSLNRIILQTDRAVGGKSTFVFVRYHVCNGKGWQRISETLQTACVTFFLRDRTKRLKEKEKEVTETGKMANQN